MKEKGGEVCINRFSVNPSSLTHCDAVGGAGPAPRQTPVPTCVPLKGGKDPRQRVGGSVKAKKPIPIHPQKLPAGLPYEFQSMPPYGGDRIALKSERWSGYFNPRPHTGGGDVRRASLSFSSSSIFFRERRFPDFPIPVSRCLFFLFASLSHLQDYGSFQIIGLFDSRENNNDVLPFSLYGEVLCCRKAIDNGRG